MELVAAAKSYEHTVKTVAQAEAERFTAQLKAYIAMPQMFRLKSYLDILEKDAQNSRKYIVSPKLSEEVYQFNFEQKERLDLVDTDITKLTNK
jgi:regulator of protease activity HflC (stomatin/prohibitin superfamily)